jgi:hypothetical protein
MIFNILRISVWVWSCSETIVPHFSQKTKFLTNATRLPSGSIGIFTDLTKKLVLSQLGLGHFGLIIEYLRLQYRRNDRRGLGVCLLFGAFGRFIRVFRFFRRTAPLGFPELIEGIGRVYSFGKWLYAMAGKPLFYRMACLSGQFR